MELSYLLSYPRFHLVGTTSLWRVAVWYGYPMILHRAICVRTLNPTLRWRSHAQSRLQALLLFAFQLKAEMIIRNRICKSQNDVFWAGGGGATCTYICTFIHIYIYTHRERERERFIYLCIYLFIHIIYIYIYMYVYTYACMCIHVCIYIYIYTHTLYACMHAYTHTYIHTCMHACIHTYIHTCMHTPPARGSQRVAGRAGPGRDADLRSPTRCGCCRYYYYDYY